MQRSFSTAMLTSLPLRATNTFENIFRRLPSPSSSAPSGLLWGILVFATLARQSRWIFVDTFTEAAFHSSGEADRTFSKLVPQMIRGSQCFPPAFVPRRLQQV